MEENREQNSAPELNGMDQQLMPNGMTGTVMRNRAGDSGEESEVDLAEVFGAILNNLVPILLCGVIGLCIAFLYTKTCMTKLYVSSTKMYILARDAQDTGAVTAGDLQAGSLVAQDYQAIIQSRQVTEAVIARLKLESGDSMMTHEQLLNMISVEIEDNTRVLTISVTCWDPYLACDIANATREVAAERIQEVMDNTQTVQMIDRANIPFGAVSPNAARNGAVGFLIGILIAIMVVVINFLSNDSVKSGEDIEKYLGISLLGTIPASSDLDDSSGSGSSGRHKKKKKKAAKSRNGGGTAAAGPQSDETAAE